MNHGQDRVRRLARFGIGALAAAAALLAGCGTIPSSGPVQRGLSNLERADQYEQYVLQYNPKGPVAGSSQEDLVRGFVLAATSPVDDYAVAREFLAPDYTAQWDPSFGVLIDDGSRPYRADGDEAGVLSLSATAKVDADGVMLPVKPGPTTDVRFEFERVGDEWRISSAPSGIILDSTTFTTIWSPHQLYFVGAGGFLIPESRWYLNRAALPTEIVGALLEGPGEQLRGVVHSGFPSGTTLVASSVPVVEGTARIDLTSTLPEAGPRAQAEVEQQLKYSLQSVPGVNGFELRIEGSTLRVPESAQNGGPKPISEINDPAVVIDGVLGTFVAGEFEEMPGFEGIAELRPTALSLAPDQSAAVALDAQGANIVSGIDVGLVDGRTDLVAPSLDAFGYVWTAAGSSAQDITVTAADGSASRLSAPWLAGRKTVALRLAPDGSRIAALVADDDMSMVLVAGVIREDDGRPSGTTEEAQVQLWAAGSARDLDWLGQQRLVVLSDAKGAGKVTLGGPGLFSSDQGSVPGGVQVSGGGSRTQLRVLGDDGDLFVPQGSGWQRIESDISVLAKRG